MRRYTRNIKLDSRTPGIFKIEATGNVFYGMCSKMYYLESQKIIDGKIITKSNYSCKGIQKWLFKNKNDDICFNRGFRTKDNLMQTYVSKKQGITYYFDKRIVQDNGIDTLPLSI